MNETVFRPCCLTAYSICILSLSFSSPLSPLLQRHWPISAKYNQSLQKQVVLWEAVYWTKILRNRDLRRLSSTSQLRETVPDLRKLQPTAILTINKTFALIDMPEEENVWADLLSRWGISNATVRAIRVVSLPKSSQPDAGFEWPSVEELAKLQEKYGVRTQGERSAEGLMRSSGTEGSRASAGCPTLKSGNLCCGLRCMMQVVASCKRCGRGQ